LGIGEARTPREPLLRHAARFSATFVAVTSVRVPMRRASGRQPTPERSGLHQYKK